MALLNEKLEKNSNLFMGYILGYSFQDLTGEFDLLRFTETHIINIELKSRDTTEKEIEDQLKRNKFYLWSVIIHFYSMDFYHRKINYIN
ncbi:hypothetical protein [Staphylococcus sp. AS1337]|uniref:hypothetical protein n=1 Tax=Staphylococcus sp. AS1337 TaxID=3434042 RepID=UPI003F579ECD